MLTLPSTGNISEQAERVDFSHFFSLFECNRTPTSFWHWFSLLTFANAPQTLNMVIQETNLTPPMGTNSHIHITRPHKHMHTHTHVHKQ